MHFIKKNLESLIYSSSYNVYNRINEISLMNEILETFKIFEIFECWEMTRNINRTSINLNQ